MCVLAGGDSDDDMPALIDVAGGDSEDGMPALIDPIDGFMPSNGHASSSGCGAIQTAPVGNLLNFPSRGLPHGHLIWHDLIGCIKYMQKYIAKSN